MKFALSANNYDTSTRVNVVSTPSSIFPFEGAPPSLHGHLKVPYPV